MPIKCQIQYCYNTMVDFLHHKKKNTYDIFGYKQKYSVEKMIGAIIWENVHDVSRKLMIILHYYLARKITEQIDSALYRINQIRLIKFFHLNLYTPLFIIIRITMIK